MSRWETENHFVSWLRLCPDNRISGNKVIGRGRLPTNNPLSIALKMAASTLRQSKTYLGAQFRRLRTRLGAPIAIKAMAAKLARLIYRMLRYGMKYVDQGAAFYELQHRHLQRSEEHTSELQSQSNLVCRLLLENNNTSRLTTSLRTRLGGCSTPVP